MQALEAGLSAAGSVGVIHLALHSSQQGLVTSWNTRLKAYIDPGTVKSHCKDAQCQDNLKLRTTPLVSNHCILTAVVLLSEENSMQGHICGKKSSCDRESLLYLYLRLPCSCHHDVAVFAACPPLAGHCFCTHPAGS